MKHIVESIYLPEFTQLIRRRYKWILVFLLLLELAVWIHSHRFRPTIISTGHISSSQFSPQVFSCLVEEFSKRDFMVESILAMKIARESKAYYLENASLHAEEAFLGISYDSKKPEELMLNYRLLKKEEAPYIHSYFRSIVLSVIQKKYPEFKEFRDYRVEDLRLITSEMIWFQFLSAFFIYFSCIWLHVIAMKIKANIGQRG